MRVPEGLIRTYNTVGDKALHTPSEHAVTVLRLLTAAREARCYQQLLHLSNSNRALRRSA